MSNYNNDFEFITPSVPSVPRVIVISKVCAIADFTDNTNTTGYIDFATNALPLGAIPIAWKAVVTGGFTGDTTAIIELGVSGDLTRFSADTAQSVFATGTVGASVLAASACDGMGAATTPRVTITGTADFTSIKTAATGAMTVHLYCILTV